MNKNFHYVKVPGGYEARYNSTVLGVCSTVKEAKNLIAETKRNMNYTRLVNKFLK